MMWGSAACVYDVQCILCEYVLYYRCVHTYTDYNSQYAHTHTQRHQRRQQQQKPHQQSSPASNAVAQRAARTHERPTTTTLVAAVDAAVVRAARRRQPHTHARHSHTHASKPFLVCVTARRDDVFSNRSRRTLFLRTVRCEPRGVRAYYIICMDVHVHGYADARFALCICTARRCCCC